MNKKILLGYIKNTKSMPENDEEMITISKKKYLSLLEDRQFLHALEAAGVDNWGGYDYAMEILRDKEK